MEFYEFLQSVVRRKVLDFYVDKIHPTVHQLHQKLRNDVPDLPEFSESTLLRFLKKINFVYGKLQRKPILFESKTVADHRIAYLQAIQRYREDGWNIFWTDETWCGANHSRKTGWMERVIPSDDTDNFDYYRSRVQSVNGYRGGFIVPSGAGKRVIILHIGSKDGFLERCDDVFISKSKSPNYHDSMNKEHFKRWFAKVLTHLPEKSVVVMDQAPYHTMIAEEYRNPTSQWSRSDIEDWLVKRNVPMPPGVTSLREWKKEQWLEYSKTFRYPKVYELEMMAEEKRHGSVKVLWLPVAHCEFNPIELVWAYIKNRVAKENTTFKIADVQTLCQEAVDTVPPTLWANCVKHVEKLEAQFRKDEGVISRSIESFVIDINEDDNEEDEEEDNDDSY